MAHQQRLTLSDLPTEIIDDISFELDDEDVTSLHAVNQELFQKTKYAYAKRHLTHVHVFLHPVSFDKLDRLTKDPIYAKHIEHITLSTYVLRAPEDRRKGTSVKPFEQGESFLIEGADQAIVKALQKASGLKSLTIAEFPHGSEPPAWGINEANRLTTFKRGSAVVTGYKSHDDIKVWSNRMMALEACLRGMSFARLPAQVELRMILEGNAPRSLPPNAHFLFRKALSSAVHLSTNVDTYMEVGENTDWLDKINPKSLDLDYDIFAWESADVAPNLSLGRYHRLASLHIANAKTHGTELNDFLGAHIGTLRQIELKNICLMWTNTGDYPWKSIFLTLAKIPELHYLWLNTLSAFPVNHADRKSDPCAAQEVGWKNKLHAKYALDILCDYYGRQGASGIWVDMAYVEETMMEKHGVTI